MAEKKKAGRPAEFDRDYVLDIATEYLICRYNRNPKELEERSRQGSLDVASIRANRAIFEAEDVRLVLKLLLRHADKTRPDWQAEFDADMWFLRQEPPIDCATAAGKAQAKKNNDYQAELSGKPRKAWHEHALDHVRAQRAQRGSLYPFMQKIDWIIKAKETIDAAAGFTGLSLPPANSFIDNGEDEI